MTELLPQAVTHPLGLALLHSLWQGIVVAAAYLLGRALVPARRASARYFLACVALLALLSLPVLTYSRVTSSLPALGEATSGRSTSARSPAVDGLAPATSARSRDRAQLLLLTALVRNSLDVGDYWHALRPPLYRVLPYLALVWIGGVLVLLLRLGGQLAYANRFRARHREPASGHWQARLDALKIRMRIRKPVALCASAQIEIPIVLGLLRPVVLMPASAFSGLSPNQVEAILCHELAHIRRHDYLANLLQSVAETLLFYHPIAWWLSGEIRKERENCCDDVAVTVLGNRVAYALALTRLEETRQKLPPHVLAASRGDLLQRVQRLLGKDAHERSSVVPALVILAALLALGLSIGTPLTRASAPSELETSHIWTTVAGDIEFDYEQGLIERTGSNALLIVEERQGQQSRKVEVTSGNDGALAFQYTVDGEAAPFGEQARSWLQATLHDYILSDSFRRNEFAIRELPARDWFTNFFTDLTLDKRVVTLQVGGPYEKLPIPVEALEIVDQFDIPPETWGTEQAQRVLDNGLEKAAHLGSHEVISDDDLVELLRSALQAPLIKRSLDGARAAIAEVDDADARRELLEEAQRIGDEAEAVQNRYSPEALPRLPLLAGADEPLVLGLSGGGNRPGNDEHEYFIQTVPPSVEETEHYILAVAPRQDRDYYIESVQ